MIFINHRSRLQHEDKGYRILNLKEIDIANKYKYTL
jgi:hypothetical protein